MFAVWAFLAGRPGGQCHFIFVGRLSHLGAQQAEQQETYSENEANQEPLEEARPHHRCNQKPQSHGSNTSSSRIGAPIRDLVNLSLSLT